MTWIELDNIANMAYSQEKRANGLIYNTVSSLSFLSSSTGFFYLFIRWQDFELISTMLQLFFQNASMLYAKMLRWWKRNVAWTPWLWNLEGSSSQYAAEMKKDCYHFNFKQTIVYAN